MSHLTLTTKIVCFLKAFVKNAILIRRIITASVGISLPVYLWVDRSVSEERNYPGSLVRRFSDQPETEIISGVEPWDTVNQGRSSYSQIFYGKRFLIRKKTYSVFVFCSIF